MLHFDCDYMEGAHPLILEKLAATNMEKISGYGQDPYSYSAAEKIKSLCNIPNGDVKFLVGGTQANAVVIGAALRSYEGVIAADTGHISVHEAGAIELGGHKVITLKNNMGKLNANDINKYMETFHSDETKYHMVYPAMVYISHPTEYGTLYSKKELEDIKNVCQKYNMLLYMDGARLGYGLGAENTDVTLDVIAKNCDIFYIGGTKAGALLGEAVVVTKPDLLPHFFTVIKQHGALLAKGWVLGIQFDTLFTDGLYFKITKSAVEKAIKIKKAFSQKGYKLYIDSPTNQQFVVLENKKMQELSKDVSFSFWEKYDENHTVVRFATSWATTDEDVKKLIEII
jgi:threonine aldolase